MQAEWLVIRYDDNGNEVVMAEVSTEVGAREIAAAFEARGHKQMYAVIDRATFDELARARR